MTESRSAGAFDAYYFKHGCGLPYERSQHWAQFFGGMADRIVSGINPGSVLDAGCAMGFLVEALRDRGVEAYGIDVSEYALSQVRQDIRPFCQAGSVLDPLPRHYDLIVCIEVLEHLPAEDAPKSITNFCQSSGDVLFSSTPSDFREATHLNVQPVEYWAEQFAGLGFFRDVDFDASFILPWSARFRRSSDPLARTVRDYERRYWRLQNENHELRLQNVEMRNRIQGLEEHVEQITSVLGWQLLEAMAPIRRYFVPPGSRRERAIINGLRRARKAPKPAAPSA